MKDHPEGLLPNEGLVQKIVAVVTLQRPLHYFQKWLVHKLKHGVYELQGKEIVSGLGRRAQYRIRRVAYLRLFSALLGRVGFGMAFFETAYICARMSRRCPLDAPSEQSPKFIEVIVAKQKTWREKLADSKDLPKVVPLTGSMRTRWGSGTIAIPAPRDVDAIMARVPWGKLITINEIRTLLAKKHGATMACPITTGIFAWIAAHAAEEAAADGATKITPYWRTLKVGGELNPKYPGGIDRLRARLEAEGHRVVAKGKRYVISDYEKHMARSLALRRSATPAARR